ncbi:Sugar phosphate isomerase/epimerase [Natronoarchaeum philippinense]|uniref:Sugar phosphate isomerase/epimerase n=1 Tax=Natronoarchaeum philippinense TaxID=558529 RepID=A0A285PAY5_NATPI|nr:sugar phosphate isomerase/epimerase [Natronoarchaeum philippinense]SNZ17021.1 Sugar phosphate isomerase/epimerase [Natronoarchaeum philippinense]
MVNTAIQLYTLHDFDVSEPTKIHIASETEVDGVELEFWGFPPDSTMNALEETNLDVAALSVGREDIEESIDEIERSCNALDCDTVILGHLSEEAFESAHATKETAATLSEFSKQFRERGLELLYHTHRHEFASLGDRTHFDLLLEEVDDSVKFELDLGWVGVAGVDPYELLETVGDRVPSIHLKDMDFETEAFVNLGEGDLDVERAAMTAIDEGVDWLVYEHEDPSDPVESVVTGASKLEKFKRLTTTR